MKKFLLFFLLSLLWFSFLFPKDILWKEFCFFMQKEGVSISAEKVDMDIWFLYDRVNIRNLSISNSIDVKSLQIKYTVINPLKVSFNGKLKNSVFKGEFYLNEKRGYIFLDKVPTNLNFMKSEFKKEKNGWKYEFHI